MNAHKLLFMAIIFLFSSTAMAQVVSKALTFSFVGYIPPTKISIETKTKEFNKNSTINNVNDISRIMVGQNLNSINELKLFLKKRKSTAKIVN
ncbi:hypothetical protein HWQ46_26700 [Shewanella sp. D64]|uniref:hypothetical protein n=1 Tax=unclassified Shewanella TaxID=196818 RepID=UPI0022BA3D1E|nr:MULTISPECIES: hypothetical protein [unclassified Shewanella]MEC4729099.1 hypothetical protein [Shewanella sp. D64]MEC4737336.1 hypothetical protein [Shewanella sp. E94]WBJ97161.1 hypothetical protein HWQ47_08700 [Shewanella sp. MTB7]